MNKTYITKNGCGNFPGPVAGIPAAFGFDPVDAKAIISVCYENLSDKAADANFSVLFTKAVVRECIHRLSKCYFNDATHTKKMRKSCLDRSDRDGGRVNMPIPYKAVYILQKQGYPKPQIAEFLNTSVAKVSQHLALARQYMANAA